MLRGLGFWGWLGAATLFTICPVAAIIVLALIAVSDD